MNGARGTFTWLTTDAGEATILTVSGLTFAPKLVIFTAFNVQSDGALQTRHGKRSIGFAAAPYSWLQKSVGTWDQDAADPMLCGSIWHEGGICLWFPVASGASIFGGGALKVTAWAADGFTVAVHEALATDAVTVFWSAVGGDEVSIELHNIAEPAATGTVDYTRTGFVAGATDQVVLLAGIQSTLASGGAGRFDSGFMVGAAGPAAGGGIANIVMVGNSDDASTTADTDGYCRSDECLAMVATGGGNPSARAALTAFLTDGFRLNWTARAVTDRRYIAVSIKGGGWQVGALSIDAATLNATASLTGVPWRPQGGILLDTSRAESAAGVVTAEDVTNLGFFTGTGARSAIGYRSENGTGAGEVNQALSTSHVIRSPTATGGTLWLGDISAIADDGFTLIVDQAGGVATEWVGYIIYGAPPATLAAGVQALTATAPVAELVAPAGDVILAAGLETVQATAPAALRLAGPVTLAATAPVVQATAGAAVRLAGGVTLAAGALAATVTAGAAVRLAGAVALAAGAPTATLTAGPAARLAGAVTLAAGALAATLTAGAALAAATIARPAGTLTAQLTAAAALLIAGAVTLPAGVTTAQLTAGPAALNVAGQTTLPAAAQTVTVTAPAAPVQAGAVTLPAGALSLTATAPGAAATAGVALPATVSLTVTAPAPVVVAGPVTVSPGVQSISATAPAAGLVQGLGALEPAAAVVTVTAGPAVRLAGPTVALAGPLSLTVTAPAPVGAGGAVTRLAGSLTLTVTSSPAALVRVILPGPAVALLTASPAGLQAGAVTLPATAGEVLVSAPLTGAPVIIGGGRSYATGIQWRMASVSGIAYRHAEPSTLTFRLAGVSGVEDLSE